MGLKSDLGTVRECKEYVGGDDSEAVVKLGKDCPDKLGTGICTVRVFGVGDLDLQNRSSLGEVGRPDI